MSSRRPKPIDKQIDGAVKKYLAHRHDFFNLAKRVETDLVENQKLKKFIHSTKFREKDPEHLVDSLRRKAAALEGTKKKFDIDATNLFDRVSDLAGVRILHIHREQLQFIDPLVRETAKVHKYIFREEPVAYTWDEENKGFYEKLGFKVSPKPSLYTSVHYVLQPHWGEIGCELQVRTLAEELWGEVSHTVAYPHPTRSLACTEQLAVLARLSSGCTRLVDSIFSSRQEYEALTARRRAKK